MITRLKWLIKYKLGLAARIYVKLKYSGNVWEININICNRCVRIGISANVLRGRYSVNLPSTDTGY